MEKAVQTETPKAPPAAQQEEESGLISKVLKVAAYPLALLAGFWATSLRVRRAAYNTAKDLGMFGDKLKEVTPQSKAVVKQIVDKVISPATFFKESIDLKTGYHKFADTRMKEAGLNRFHKQWQYMSEGKQDAVLDGITVAGITIGALLTIASSKTLTHLFAKKAKKEEQQGQER